MAVKVYKNKDELRKHLEEEEEKKRKQEAEAEKFATEHAIHVDGFDIDKANQMYGESKRVTSTYTSGGRTDTSLWGDIVDNTQTLGATIADFGLNAARGFFSTGEGVVDFVESKAADIGEFFVGENDFSNFMREAAAKDITGAVFGDNNLLGIENWQNDIQERSLSNDFIDSVGQGLGNILAFQGFSGLGSMAGLTSKGAQVATSITGSYTSAYGNSYTELLRQGVDKDTARKNATINAVAETISEQVFNKIPFVTSAGWGDKAAGRLADSVSKYFKNEALGKLVITMLDGLSEGSEEVISNLINQLGNDILYMFDPSYTLGKENSNLANGYQFGDIFGDLWDAGTSKDSINSFLSASLSSFLMSGAKGLTDKHTQNKVINAYAKDNGISFEQAKGILNEMMDNAKQEIKDDKTEYNSQTELNEMAQDRILNYMNIRSNEKMEAKIEQKIQDEQKEKGVTYTPEEIEKRRLELRTIEEDSLNSPKKYQQFTLEKEPTDEKHKVLYESFRKTNRNNTEESHKIYNLLSSLLDANKNSNYQLINNELLKAQGVKPVKVNGKDLTINGFYKNGVVNVNTDAKNSYEKVVYHEIGHAIKETSQEIYDELANLVYELKGREQLEEYRKLYNVKEGETSSNLTDNYVDEYINDKLGEILQEQKFVDRITQHKNLVQRLLAEIKRMIKYMASGKEKKKLMDAQKAIEEKFEEGLKNATFKGSEDTQLSLGKKKSRLYNVSNELRTEIEEKTKERFAKNRDVVFVDIDDVISKRQGYRTKEEVEGIINGIKRNGITEAIEVFTNEDGNLEIYDGNHRYEIAKNMGIEQIPVTFTDNTDIEKYKNIEYNKAKEGIINDEYGSNESGTENVSTFNENNWNQQTNGIGDNNTSTNIQASQNDAGLYNGVQGNDNRPSSISKNGKNNNEGELESSFNLPQYSLSQDEISNVLSNNGIKSSNEIMFDEDSMKYYQEHHQPSPEVLSKMNRLSDFIKEHKSDFDDIEKRPRNVNSGYYFVDDNIVKLSTTLEGDKLYIDELYVEKQKQGAGRKVVDALKQFANENDLEIETFKELSTAKGFWDKVLNRNAQYSLSQDSQGRELSQEQQEYFKDSKVRTPDGSLRVMYRGGNETFNVFDRSKANPAGQLGNGFYFTTAKSHAEQYGNAKEYYLNITNPLNYSYSNNYGKNESRQITKEQLYKLVDEMRNNEDYSIENYGYGQTTQDIVDSLDSKNTDYDILSDLNTTAVGNMAEFIEYVNDTIGTNYDGIITDYETIVLNSNQIKNVDNTNPTNNPDIRYSLSTDSKGRELSQEQQEYFKDSKVRDNEGRLLEVYHGTPNAGFTIYDSNRLGETTGAEDTSLGFHLTDNEQLASFFSGVVGDEAYNEAKQEIYEKYNIDANENLPFDMGAKVNQEIADLAEEKAKQKGEVKHQYINITKPLSVFADYGIDESQLARDLVYAATGEEDISNVSDYYESNEDMLLAIQQNFDDELAQLKDELSKPESIERIKEMGYDGLILPMTNKDKATIKGNGNEYVVFNSNQIKNTDNTNPTLDTDIRYSLSQDSQGRELSEQQQEYFKDSKVRDDEGRLLEVYHGTNYDFTVFENPERQYNEYASGKEFANTSISMFTDSQEVAQTYIDNVETPNRKPMSVYLNMANPYIVDADYQKNTYFFDNDGTPTNVNTLVKRIYDSGEYDGIIIKNVADLGNYEDYDVTDGRQYATDYIVFNSNQVKNVDNTNPTSNPDIRYSLSEENYNEEQLTAIKKQIPRYSGMNTEQLNREYTYASDSYNEMVQLSNQYQQEYKDYQKTPEFMDALQNYKFESEAWLKGDEYADKIRYYNREAEKYFAQREAINSLLMDTQKDTRSAKQIVKEAEKHFGVTDNFKETAYITTNGKQLDFSGYHEGGMKGTRSLDHRQVSEIDTDMDSFIAMGNIRVLPESGGINLEIEPNAKQYSMLRDYIEYAKQNNDEIYVDVVNPNGGYDSISYRTNTPTSKIINDIKDYFTNGKFNEQSEFSAFYSLSETKDSQDRDLSKQQRDYFKDSKVRDDEGRLLEVYHGTNNNFNTFRSEYNEYYFTDDKNAAADYGGNIRQEYLNLTNPYIVDFEGRNDKANDLYENGIFDVIDYAKENGYDGVIAKNTFDGANTHNQYVAFAPNQIKNIDNINPTSDADTRYQLMQESNLPTGFERTKRVETYNDYLDYMNLPTSQSTQGGELPFYVDENMPKTIEERMSEVRKKLADSRFNNMMEKQTFKSVKESTKMAKSYLDFNTKQTEEFKKSISKLAKLPKDNLIKAKNYNQLKDIISKYANKDINFVNEELKSAQKDVKNTELIVSEDLKNQITDWADFRKTSGLKIRTGQKSNVDVVYQELLDTYPGMLDNTITNYADQLQELKEFVKRDSKYVQHFELNEDSINQITNKVWEKLSNNALTIQEINAIQNDITMKLENRTREVVRQDLLDQMGLTEQDIAQGKDITSLGYQMDAPVRINEKVFGAEVGRKINEATTGFVKQQEAKSIRFQNQERREISELGIKARSKESAAVQKFGEKQYVNDKGELVQYTEQDLRNEFKDEATIEKIKNAAAVLRQKYDKYIDMINSSLVEMGYDPIPKRQDYFKHFQELDDKLSNFGWTFSPENIMKEELPTDINGLTADFKPGKNYFASALQRKGLKTKYDAITGIDTYLSGASNLIFHTESIQRYRALSKLIRDTYGQTHGAENIDLMTPEQAQQRLQDIYDNKLTRYAAWLDEQANALAGKKAAIDRSVERIIGRKGYTFLNAMKKQVGSNMTGYNVRSALTNFASAIQGASKTQKLAAMKGFVFALKNYRNLDPLIAKSDFLATRFGTDSLSKKTWQKISEAGQVFMNATDRFTSLQIWGGKYFEGLQNGLTEQQAIKQADEFAPRIMGDRSKGQTAEIFNSKTLGFLTQFQLEVNNQWQSMIHDTKMDYKQNPGLKAGLHIANQLGQLFVASWVFNNLMKAVTGSDVMFDPIDLLMGLFNPDDDDKSLEDRATDMIGKIVNQLPMASIMTGGRIPISEAFKGAETGFKYLTHQTDQYGNTYTLDDVKNDFIGSFAYYLLPTGYGQLKKTTQGLGMYTHELPGSYTDSGRLRFEADTSPLGMLQAGLFGQYASSDAREYFDKGLQPLTEKKVQEARDANLPIKEYRKIDEGISKAKKEAKERGESQQEAQYDYIYNLPLDMNTRNKLLNSRLNTSDNVTDDNGYIKYTDGSKTYWYDEKNNVVYNSKYRKMDNIKVSQLEKYSNVKDIADYGKYGSLAEFNYANSNPEKYLTSQQIAKYDDYVKYKDDIAAIKDNYNDGTTAGKNKAKQEVFNYINALKLNKTKKLMLQKMAGGYSIKSYRNEIVNYLDSLDLTRKEKAIIYEELIG